MKHPIITTASLAVGTAALVALPGTEAQANDVLDLGKDRTILIQEMPGEAGVGVGAVFSADDEMFVAGVFVDHDRNQVLEVEFEMIEVMTLDWIPPGDILPADRFGVLFGEVYLPADSQNDRELVGLVEGEWQEENGKGALAGVIFDPGDSGTPDSTPQDLDLAGYLQGFYSYDDGGNIVIDPHGDLDGDLGQPTGGGGGLGGIDPQDVGFGGDQDFEPGGGGLGDGADLTGPDWNVDGMGGGFGGAGVGEVDPEETDGYLFLRWKIFD